VRVGQAPVDTTGTFNIGTGQQTTLTEVYAHIAAALDGASPWSAAAGDADESQTLALNSAKAGADLGWRPRVDLAEGIRRTMDWLCATLEESTLASA
jgi:UDP-glucose 4-epimerase